MAEGNSSGGFGKSRSVLGDLTNLPRKREGCPEIENCGSRSSSFSGKETAKRIRLSSVECNENSPLKDNFDSSTPKATDENREVSLLGFGSAAVSKGVIGSEIECSDGRCLKHVGDLKAVGGDNDVAVSNCGEGAAVSKIVENFISGGDTLDKDKLCSRDCEGPNFDDFGRGIAGSSAVAVEVESELMRTSEVSRSDNLLSGKKIDFPDYVVSGNAVEVTSTDVGEVALNPKIDSSSIDHAEEVEHGNAGAGDELGDSFPADTSRTVSESGGDGENFDADDYRHDGDDHNADNFILSQCGSVDGMFIPESQESTVFGVERFTEQKKAEEYACINEGADSIKSCGCSFCTRAAYMWLDLNYQDIKARVSAMKKSQKEASILAERSIRSKASEKAIAETSTSVSNLEYDLMHQWRSLFQHMANLLDEEGKELEARLIPLTELREKYKADSESSSAGPAEK